MALYILNRKHTMRSIYGHSITFEKGQPTHVPPICEREAVSIGAELAEGDAADLLPPEPAEVTHVSSAARNEELNAAFDMLVEKNDTNDFTGQGVPSVKAVSAIVSFETDRVEIVGAWNTYKVAKAEAAAQ